MKINFLRQGDASGKRLLELDSLRGIAAIIVLNYHVLAINLQAFANASQGLAVEGKLLNLVSYTPIRFLWAGGEAVWMFFILSGLALTLSTRTEGFSWNSYFPRRTYRLLLPVYAAILITWLSFKLVPHVITPLNESLLGNAATSYPLPSLLTDFFLLSGPTNALGPIWSLRWEVLFSLSLPLYIYAAHSKPKIWLITAWLTMMTGIRYANDYMTYLPIFYFGVFFSTLNLNRMRIAPRKRFVRILIEIRNAFLILLSISFISSQWIMPTKIISISERLGFSSASLFSTLKVLGICLLLALSLTWPLLSNLLRHPALVYLGKISFSVYLVHWPIVISTAFALGPGPLSATIGFMASLGSSILFFKFIESRIHKRSKQILVN